MILIIIDLIFSNLVNQFIILKQFFKILIKNAYAIEINIIYFYLNLLQNYQFCLIWQIVQNLYYFFLFVNFFQINLQCPIFYYFHYANEYFFQIYFISSSKSYSLIQFIQVFKKISSFILLYTSYHEQQDGDQSIHVTIYTLLFQVQHFYYCHITLYIFKFNFLTRWISSILYLILIKLKLIFIVYKHVNILIVH